MVEQVHLAYAAVGITGLGLALVSRRLREWPLSEPLVALVLGVVLGPQVAGLVELAEPVRDQVLLEGSRLLLAWSVMAAALRFPARELRRLLAPVVLLLVVVMPLAAVTTGAVALLLGVPLAIAALIGACLCPTDPVLAASVVTGEPAQRDLPARLRQLLTVESGANDGLALPLVLVALTLVLPSRTLGNALELTWQVLTATLIGAAVGALTGLAVRLSERHRVLEHGPKIVLTLLLAVAVLGLCRLAHSDGVLGAFVAGLVYNRCVDSSDREPQEGVDEAVNRYAVLPLFVVLGAVLPWQDWAEFGPAAVGFAVGILVLRRLPFVLALARPLGLRRRDAVFAGWFGPMGVSAVFYLAHSTHEGVSDPRLFAAGSLAVAVSVLAFGTTSSPARKLYARH